MATIKWSTGETYQQSYKKLKQQMEVEDIKKDVEEAIPELSRNYVFKDSYKEQVSSRVGEREHIQQNCVNPYLGNNFIKDLAVQEEYLKPKNSHFSK
tara:strand:+ start:628 stop:918 length:291 start_codon:yes stop_codon:yes gene_type:complete